MKRDPERTKHRILGAALKEFAAKGFAGARVDAIARRARVNKRMLYHYFGDKRALYRETFRRKWLEKTEVTRANPQDPLEAMPYWYDEVIRDTDWVRLLSWDAVSTGPASVIPDDERRQLYAEGIAWLQRAQATGLIAEDLDTRLLFLAFIAVNTFPAAFPQITRAITGWSFTDPEFIEAHKLFSRRLAEHLRPLAAEAKAAMPSQPLVGTRLPSGR